MVESNASDDDAGPPGCGGGGS